jgi:predicted membrane metal-binding protein
LVELLVLLLLAVAVWFISESLKARELAYAAARRACEEAQVQFLDDTVSQSGMRLARDADGRATLERYFRFEFSTTGDDRLQGRVRLLGGQVQDVNLAHLWLVS